LPPSQMEVWGARPILPRCPARTCGEDRSGWARSRTRGLFGPIGEIPTTFCWFLGAALAWGGHPQVSALPGSPAPVPLCPAMVTWGHSTPGGRRKPCSLFSPRGFSVAPRKKHPPGGRLGLVTRRPLPSSELCPGKARGAPLLRGGKKSPHLPFLKSLQTPPPFLDAFWGISNPPVGLWRRFAKKRHIFLSRSYGGRAGKRIPRKLLSFGPAQ